MSLLLIFFFIDTFFFHYLPQCKFSHFKVQRNISYFTLPVNPVACFPFSHPAGIFPTPVTPSQPDFTIEARFTEILFPFTPYKP